MSQQLVKKGANGRMINVNPKSWIEAIKDKNTGQTLVEILQGFNMYFLSYNGNTISTRCLVPTMLRKKGLWITYVKYDGNVYTEWYAADELDDKSWGDSSNWRIGNNTLVGDITISANGNWVINGTETEFKAVGEKGNTPLIRVANNRLQVSYDLGDTYIDVTNNPVYTKFRWLATTGDTQANNVGRIQASTDEGKTWTNMSNDFTNNLHISRYIGVNESLPTSGIAEGTIYAKGPYYAEDDTLNDNPIYRLWVYAWKGNTLAWQDNGEFQSIVAGVVQKTGDSETQVMSQKAVTEKLSELGSEVDNLELGVKEFNHSYSEESVDIDSLAILKGSLLNTNVWSDYSEHSIIPVQPNRDVVITANSSTECQYAFLKTYNYLNGANADVCDGYGYSRLYANKTITIKTPDLARYLYIRIGTTTPSSVVLKGLESFKDKTTQHLESLDYNVKKNSVVNILASSSLNAENTPARSDLSIDSARGMKGYKCDLTGLYSAGIRYVYFTGATYASDSTVVAGIVIDKNGNKESEIKTVEQHLKPYWLRLPITENSKTLWASYVYDDSSNGIPWTPSIVYFNGQQYVELEDKLNDINIVLNDVNSKKTFYLKGKGVSGIGIIKAVGDCYYNTKDKLIHECYSYVDENHFSTKTYSPNISSIYIFKEGLYLWNGTDFDFAFADNNNYDKKISENTANINLLKKVNGLGGYITVTGQIIKLVSPFDGLVIPNDTVVYTENIFDQTTLKKNVIINDNGEEVSDTSSYYSQKIPVVGYTSLAANFVIQRLYYYGINGAFLGRTIPVKQVVPVQTEFNGEQVGWVQIQVQDYSQVDNKAVVYGTEIPVYTEYKTNTEGNFYEPFCYLVSNDLSNITINKRDDTLFKVSAIEIPGVWEPKEVDEGYSSPIGRTNVVRDNWENPNKFLYYDFIENYYDIYVGGTYNDGYQVRKKSLGNDCSNEGYELFEFDFIPNNYIKTVLISAGMNTCETGAIWGLATFVRELMNPSEDGMKFLHDNVRFKIIPIMCPYSFDQPTLLYLNKNGVRINKNFNYKTSWSTISGSGNPKGGYPDSEAETIIIKKWINDNANKADLWIDCHQDPDENLDTSGWVSGVFCSDATTKSKLEKCFSKMLDFYKDKGYCDNSITVENNFRCSVEGGFVYPKTRYSHDVCGVPALMIEQYCASPLFGSDGKTINDAAGIKNYVLELRLYTFAVLAKEETLVDVGTFGYNSYQANK